MIYTHGEFYIKVI